MFYDRFLALCEAMGVKPGRACAEMGVSRSLAAKWKATGTEKPSTEVLERMSAYFNMPIDKILTDEEIPETGDPGLTEILEQMKNRPEMRMLFKLSADATPDDVRKAIAIIEALRKEE